MSGEKKEDYEKQMLIDSLEELPARVVAMAYLYALNYELSYTERVEEKYQNILRDLNELSQDLAKEIRKPKFDRYKISTIAGKIGTETWRHL